jgi:hypothetical protein
MARRRKRTPSPAGAPSSDIKTAARYGLAGTLTAALIAAAATLYAVVLAPNPDPTPSPTVAAGPASDNPLNISAAIMLDRCSDSWVVPLRPDAIPAPTGGDLSAWTQSAGGAAARMQRVELHIDGNSESQTVIRNIRAVAVGTRVAAVSEGTLVGIGCGGPGSYRAVVADLDTEPPKMTPKVVGAGGEDAQPGVNLTPIRFPYEVSATDSESFLIEAYATRFDVYWHLEVDWTFKGQDGTTVVKNNGQLFRTTGRTNAPHVCFWNEGGQPIPSLSKNCPAN